MTRKEAIEELITNNIDTIETNNVHFDTSFVYDLLNNGFKGYNNFTDSELEIKYEEMFNEKIKII